MEAPTKFINEETLGYFKAKAGIDNDSRFEVMDNYLVALNDYLDKIEEDNQIQIRDLESRLNEALKAQVKINSELSIISRRYTESITDLRKRLGILVCVSVVTSLFAVASGVVVWLVK